MVTGVCRRAVELVSRSLDRSRIDLADLIRLLLDIRP
jgi:hypothetical protein